MAVFVLWEGETFAGDAAASLVQAEIDSNRILLGGRRIRYPEKCCLRQSDYVEKALQWPRSRSCRLTCHLADSPVCLPVWKGDSRDAYRRSTQKHPKRYAICDPSRHGKCVRQTSRTGGLCNSSPTGCRRCLQPDTFFEAPHSAAARHPPEMRFASRGVLRALSTQTRSTASMPYWIESSGIIMIMCIAVRVHARTR